MTALHAFRALRKFLEGRGVNIVESDYHAEVLRRDFSVDQEAGTAEIDQSGVFFKVKGKRVRGFLYIKEANIGRFGYPKAHFIDCITIQDKKAAGKFDHQYFWSNGKKVLLIDRSTLQEVGPVELQLCKNCIAGGDARGAKSSGAFVEAYGDECTIPVDTKTDANGYPLDWHRISEQYRKGIEYRCESCGVKIKRGIDRRFMHVHHLNGDKLNNDPANLRCLCVLCHAFADDHHSRRMIRGAFRVHLQDYYRIYRDELEQNKNPYIDRGADMLKQVGVVV
ncbi:HNH endonuclease [bacterium]|nr:HNH endonuclease [bacterium]